MNKKQEPLLLATSGGARRLWRWFRALLALIDDVTWVRLAGFLVAGSGLAAVHAVTPAEAAHHAGGKLE